RRERGDGSVCARDELVIVYVRTRSCSLPTSLINLINAHAQHFPLSPRRVTRLTHHAAMSKPAEDDSVPPPLVGFVNTLPSPVVAVLIGLAPHIARIRHYVQVISWKSSSEESWIAVALWWTSCAVSDVVQPTNPDVDTSCRLQSSSCSSYLARRQNQICLLRRSQRTPSNAPSPTSLLFTPSSHLPPPALSDRLPPLVTLLRTFAILYIPYLLLTHFIRLRILLAIAGTVLLTWRARWAILLRRSLWRSAFLRWSLYRAWSLLSGMPLPPAFLPQTLSAPPSPRQPLPCASSSLYMRISAGGWASTGPPPSSPVSALPGVLPPSSPSPPDRVRPPRIHHCVHVSRRSAESAKRALEDEWRVVVRRDGAASARVERPLPSPKEEGAAASSANRILRAAGKMRQTSISSLSPERGKERERDEGDAGAAHAEQAAGEAADAGTAEDAGEEEEPCTDADGWIYGDNKWEGGTSKGGMGKYTRYRRWTRIAVLTETAELVGPGELGVVRDEIPPAPPALPQETRRHTSCTR
ncbi:hypothetical protein A0H81_13972, partial [Grifola frondosa]